MVVAIMPLDLALVGEPHAVNDADHLVAIDCQTVPPAQERGDLRC
jgi:hypothetical protein